MRKKVLSLIMALMLITCFCTSNIQAADNYVTRLGVTVDYQIDQYLPVEGDSTFVPFPSRVYTTFNLNTYGIVNYYAENVGRTTYSLTYVSTSGDILNPYIRFRYVARSAAGSLATGYVLVGYFS